MKIHNISAREILDSRGNPTISTTVELEDGVIAEASVPSGASRGENEAVELRDADKTRFGGLGELKAVSNVNTKIAPALIGMDSANQSEIDQKLLELDGTENEKNLGANAILSVSLAVARAEAISQGVELFEYLSVIFSGAKVNEFSLPTPMFNILNGGAHAANNIDIQETMVVPIGLASFEEKLRAGSEIYHSLKSELSAHGYAVGLGDEGGFAPELTKNEMTMEHAQKAITSAGYTESEVRISLDVASSEFYDSKKGEYNFKNDKKKLTSAQMIKKMTDWAKKYKLLSIEDGLSESDQNWPKLKNALGDTIAVGDDLFTTNPERIEKGLEENWAGGVIIKPNQIGTLSATLEAIRVAKAGGMKVIVSHRSGETEDSFIADLAVAVGAEFIKSGAPARSERLAKYNRLTKIEDFLAENY